MEWISSLSFELLIALLALPLIVKNFVSVRNHRILIKKKILKQKCIGPFEPANKRFTGAQ
jgi:hypothetical protein